MPDDNAEFLTTEDVAALVRTSQAALYQMRRRGRGPKGFRVVSKLLFKRADIDAWIAQQAEVAQ